MNYFNYKFLKENIKKSKGLIILALIVLPLINVFAVLLFLKSGFRLNLATFGTLSLVTGISAFVVPIMLAYILFGFVFKKKSIDFYLSKPISRKGIFITNVIGGFILITVFILINSLLYLLLGLFTNLVVPFALIIDYFVYWWIAYLFMFVISIVSISISSNIITSFVALCLLFFFCPFMMALNDSYKAMSTMNYQATNDQNSKIYSFKCYDEECYTKKSKGVYKIEVYTEGIGVLTAPVNALIYQNYDSKSVVKTLIVSVIYLIGGYYIFLKRKMENCECGLKNPYLHYVLKTLVFFPICYFIYVIISSASVGETILSCLCSCGAIAFYILYDVITRRELYKFKQSLCIFLLSFGLFQGLFYCLEYFYSNKELTIHDEVKEISFSDENRDYKITDEDLIADIMVSILNNNGNSNISGSKIKINNKNYNINIYLEEEVEEKINNYFENKGLKNKYQLFNYDGLHFANTSQNGYIPVTKKLKEYTKELMNNDIAVIGDVPEYLQLYNYKNHEYEIITIPINASNDLYTYVGHTINQLCLDNMKSKNSLKYISYIYYHISDINFENEERKIENLINTNYNEFIEFLEKHKNDEVKAEYIKVWIGSNNNSRDYYFIWDIEAFEEEILKYQNN